MIENVLDEVIFLRHELHKKAELSLNEKKTKAYLMNWIKERDEKDRIQLIDMGKWFFAFIESNAKEKRDAIAFRGDMDALPIKDIDTLSYKSETEGVSHRCGHDGHSANLAMSTLLISEMELDRDVYMIFQHAEEIGAGGEECSKLIKEKNIKSIYAFHNWSGYTEDAIIVKPGITHCASMGITFKFIGKTSHASEPEKGINPADAISKLILFSSELTKSDLFTDKVMATIVNVEIGSKNFGINAGEGSVSMTLRGFKESEMHLLKEKLIKKADLLKSEKDLTLQIEENDIFPETVNDEEAVKRVIEAADELQIPVEIMKDPIRSSEDFGYFQKECMGAMFYIGNGLNYPAVHTLPYDYRDDNFEITIPMFMKLALLG